MGWMQRRMIGVPERLLKLMNMRRTWHIVGRGKTNRQLLGSGSRFVFYALMLGVFVCTPLDILPQSFSSGQYWNSIIVINAVSLTALLTFLIRVARAIDLRRCLARIPRLHQLSERDMPQNMWSKVQREKMRCRTLFDTQTDFTRVRHAGLQNPYHSEAIEENEWLEAPYWEVVETIPMFMEVMIVQVMPDLRRPPGATMREYLAMAIDQGVVDGAHMQDASALAQAYDRARYSGHALTDDQLLDLMRRVGVVLRSVAPRLDTAGTMRNPNLWQGKTRSTGSNSGTRSSLSLGSVLVGSDDEFDLL